MKLETSRYNFEKYSSIKFHESTFSVVRGVPCGRTDGRTCRTMEFLDNGANFNTSLVNKRTSSSLSKAHTPHCIHKRRVESYYLPQMKSLKNKKEPSNNVECVYSVVYVFLRRWKKSSY